MLNIFGGNLSKPKSHTNSKFFTKMLVKILLFKKHECENVSDWLLVNISEEENPVKTQSPNEMLN